MKDRRTTYHLVQHVDGNAGFCAIVTYALNGIRMAVRDGAVPVVYYGPRTTRFFHERSVGDNVWEYYFHPVAGVSYDDLRRALESGDIDPGQVHSFEKRQICTWHQSDPERVATFWAKDVPEDPAAWMAAKRALGRRFVSGYIRVKDHVLAKVDAFEREHFVAPVTLGVHIRGTDFAYAEPTPPRDYFDAIDAYVREHRLGDYRVFVATDQNQFLDLFRRRYGARVVATDCVRSNRGRAPFKFSSHSPYRRGEDVLVDVLLLSRCDFLFKGAAAVGEFALYFNPGLECHDFALRSAFDPRHFKELTSAYRKLDIAQWSPPWWSPRRWRREARDLWYSLLRRLGRRHPR